MRENTYYKKQNRLVKNIEYIQSKGFRVVGRYIYKKSERTNRRKVVGQLNENNFFFYSDNVYPFKSGINFFNEKTLTHPQDYKKYIKEEIQKEHNDINIIPQFPFLPQHIHQ